MVADLDCTTTSDELDALALELFTSTYGMTMDEAYSAAAEQLATLIGFAACWDVDSKFARMRRERPGAFAKPALPALAA